MLTLFSGLIGFLGALLPEWIKLIQEKADRQHELAILDRQMQMQLQGKDERLGQLEAGLQALSQQSIYQTWKNDIYWVDALNGSVRPVLAYAFFALYAAMKCLLLQRIDWQQAPLIAVLEQLWSEEDQAIFASIISFYFGQRAFRKMQGKK